MARNARKPGDIAGCYYCAMTIGRLPGNASALFLSHGGGPLPLLGDPAHEEMIDGLRYIAAAIERPEAIIVISAHWEQAVATITGAGKRAVATPSS